MDFHFLGWSLWLGVSELGSCSRCQVFPCPQALTELGAVLCFPSMEGPSEKGLLGPPTQALHHCKPYEGAGGSCAKRVLRSFSEGLCFPGDSLTARCLHLPCTEKEQGQSCQKRGSDPWARTQYEILARDSHRWSVCKLQEICHCGLAALVRAERQLL